MGCRIGMATNLEIRMQELKQQRKVPQYARVSVIKDRLLYDDATELEVTNRRICGPNCDGEAGGRFVPGYVWSVYRLDW